MIHKYNIIIAESSNIIASFAPIKKTLSVRMGVFLIGINSEGFETVGQWMLIHIIHKFSRIVMLYLIHTL